MVLGGFAPSSHHQGHSTGALRYDLWFQGQFHVFEGHYEIGNDVALPILAVIITLFMIVRFPLSIRTRCSHKVVHMHSCFIAPACLALTYITAFRVPVSFPSRHTPSSHRTLSMDSSTFDHFSPAHMKLYVKLTKHFCKIPRSVLQGHASGTRE